MAKQDEYIGQTFGEYKVKKLIGKGGMSRVYQGEDQNLGRDVAIKIITLDPDRAKELMKRFEREGRTMGKLDRHPNIVRVYRYQNVDDPRYLVMEYINGETLTQIMARYKNQGKYMPFEELVRIMGQVADALDFAHSNDVIHRDIKPSNIMIEETGGRAVLMDFGLVMQVNTDTTLGTAFGTPRYISPEQAISSQQAVPQSDIYSLGVIIYEAITGKAPFDDESAMSLALSHITNPPPNPQDVREDLSDEVANALLKALEKTPEDRYQTAREMVEALAKAMKVETEEKVVATPAKPPVMTSPPSPSPSKAQEKKEEPKKVKTPPVVKKENKPEKENSGSGNLRWLLIVGGVVLLAIVVGVLALSNGDDGDGGDDDNGDNSGNGGNNSATFRASDEIRLRWTNDYLVIYNQSGTTQDITGVEFVSEDGDKRFITRDVGANSLQNFVPQRCVHVFIRNQKQGPPSFCKESDQEIRELVYNSQRNEGNTLNWVWVDDGTADTFDVVLVLGGQDPVVLQTCPINEGRCTFSVPERD